MSSQVHQSDPRILDRRTLERDFRRLAAVLQPGMRVLDVGCGTGAITAGIARAVGPDGRAVGIDRDAGLLGMARARYSSLSNLEFQQQDVLTLAVQRAFDIVSTARMLQWIDQPELALRRMAAAAKTAGLVIALEYNHAQNSWEPEPPQAFRAFYSALLRWREANNWDNEIGDRLPAMFQEAGLMQVVSHNEDEITHRGDPEFSDVSKIWSHVIETIGPTIVAAGYLSKTDRLDAAASFDLWCAHELMCQTFVARVVKGYVR